MEENVLEKKENEVASNNNNSNKNGIIAILVVIIIALIGVVIYFAFIKKDEPKPNNNGSNNQTNNDKKYENTFKYSSNGSYGVAYAKGYAKVKREYYCESVPVDECNETNALETNDAVYFYVTSTESKDLKKEVNEWFSEQSKDAQSIQLGCLKNDTIEFVAFADNFYRGTNDEHKNLPEYYAKVITLSKADSNKIISSSESNQITLKMEKLKYSNGFATDGYTCLSRMTNIEIVE